MMVRRIILADALIRGVLKGPNYLTGVSAHTNALAAGALLAFVQGIAIVAIALLLFPLFRRTSEPLALAYVGFRVAELAATLFYVVTPLLVINVGNATLSTSASRHLGALFQGQRTVFRPAGRRPTATQPSRQINARAPGQSYGESDRDRAADRILLTVPGVADAAHAGDD